MLATGKARISATLAAALAMAGCVSSSAIAASLAVTHQATAADAVFLAYAPPPAGGAGALCLVDTGVNATLDTTPGLVSATALDGGSGADVDPLMHGTVDATIAGGAGAGMLGAWPQLKIVSVRSTDVPAPGQEPGFEFDDYVNGILACTKAVPGVRVLAIDLPLSSVIPPTPDQTAVFANATTQAQAQGIALLAAAGNSPGAIQLPASEPGIMAVGADDAFNAGTDCAFSASTGLTFYAPGCFLDEVGPSDQAVCCGNGTSQASAFAAGVLVALRSYDPTLTPDKAEQLLLSTTHNGQLDVGAAFRADGLGTIVDAGTAAIPQPPPLPVPVPVAAASAPPRVVAAPVVVHASWRRGVLRVAVRRLPKGAHLHATLTFADRRSLHLTSAHRLLRAHTSRPARVGLRITQGGVSSATVKLKL